MQQSEIAIKVESVSKTYKLYDKPIDRLKEALHLSKKEYHKEFYALHDISFEIKKGETVGVIGTNGSGKSTLLKILTGVLDATSGTTAVDGKISALLELGAGFNLEYTGLENIYLNGTIMGHSREEMKEKVPQIIEFADIGDFINQPVKTYSSGMFVRLAFATQIYSDPDVLIVDEALSVGDMRFQQKCYRAMKQLMKDKTVLIVSHDPGAISRFCTRAIWLERGELMFDGQAEEALKKYQSFILNNMKKEEIDEHLDIAVKEATMLFDTKVLEASVEKAGTGEAEIVCCGLFTENGETVTEIMQNETYVFAMDVVFETILKDCIVGLTVKDRLGGNVFAINSFMTQENVDPTKKQYQYQFKIQFPSLNAGEYTISPALAIGSMVSHVQVCWAHDAWIFQMKRPDYELPGVIYMDRNSFEIKMMEL